MKKKQILNTVLSLGTAVAMVAGWRNECFWQKLLLMRKLH